MNEHEPKRAPVGLLAVMRGSGEAPAAKPEEPAEEPAESEPEAQVVAGSEVMSALRSGDSEAFTRALKAFIRITRMLDEDEG